MNMFIWWQVTSRCEPICLSTCEIVSALSWRRCDCLFWPREVAMFCFGRIFLLAFYQWINEFYSLDRRLSVFHWMPIVVPIRFCVSKIERPERCSHLSSTLAAELSTLTLWLCTLRPNSRQSDEKHSGEHENILFNGATECNRHKKILPRMSTSRARNCPHFSPSLMICTRTRSASSQTNDIYLRHNCISFTWNAVSSFSFTFCFHFDWLVAAFVWWSRQ